MTTICYLMDENMPPAVRDQLLRRESTMAILSIGDDMVPAFSTRDPEILIWVEQNGYILVSRNRRTLPTHLADHLAAGHHVPGIFLLKRRYALGRVIEDWLLIWHASRPDEYLDQIVYLPL